jgi:hypothetical protein
MGSSRKPKPRGQPRRVAPPGSALGDVGSAFNPEVLTITLVRVDAQVARAVSVGESVFAPAQGLPACNTQAGERLGDIPPRFLEVVNRGYQQGEISKCTLAPLVVEVSLWG